MTTYKFKTRPYKHQVKAVKHLFKNGRGMLACDMGTGKTKMAIDFAGAAHLKWGTSRVLVLTKVSMIGSWMDEVAMHCGVPSTTWPHDLGPERPTPPNRVWWRISNYERTLSDQRKKLYLKWLAEDPHSILVLDESHMIKNPSARRSKAAYGLSKVAGHVVLMTGTMVAKNPLDVFSQFKVIDDNVFGTNFSGFKRQYCIQGGYGGHQVLEWINQDDMVDKMAPLTFRARKKDCLDLPDKTHKLIHVDLEPKTAKVYDAMVEDSIAEIEDGTLTAPLVITRMLRLAQITGGWMKLDATVDTWENHKGEIETATAEGEYKKLGTEKVDAFGDLYEGMLEEGVNRVVVFCRFLKEVDEVARRVKKMGSYPLVVTGAVPHNRRSDMVRMFQSDRSEPMVFVSQVETGSLGITLTRASDAVFLSHPHSHSVFDQACDRIHRIGQTKACTYHHILARGTVDDDVFRAIHEKRAVAEVITEHPNMLRRKK